MVKKLLVTISMVGLIPASVVQAEEYVATDAELEMYEDQLDLMAQEKFGTFQEPMARRSGRNERDAGRDLAIGVIGAIVGAIGDDVNNRRPPGHQPPGSRPGRPGNGGNEWDPPGRPGNGGNEWDGDGGWDGRDDWNRPRPRQIRCFAVDGRRRYYQAVGQVKRRVERRALNICYNHGARVCRIAHCEPVRRR